MNTTLVGLLGELRMLSGINHKSNITGEDLYLKCISNFPIKNNGTFYQADIVVLCRTGVYCIEVKTWNCIIRNVNNKYWNLHYPTRDIKVFSPPLQNQIHCRLLSKLTCQPVNNIVLLAGSTICSERPDGVYYLPEFLNYLSTCPTVLAVEQIDKIMQDLLAYKQAQGADMLVDFILKQSKR